jgi:REP element-mobilizing transposase RayT
MDGVMGLNEVGQIVTDVWGETPDHFPNVSNPVFVVMPDHFHGIIEINEKIEDVRTVLGEGARHASPVRGRMVPNSLGAIIGSFKSAVSRRVHQLPGYETCGVWQRNYYEHIVRDQADYERIVAYIQMNPLNWQNGKED